MPERSTDIDDAIYRALAKDLRRLLRGQARVRYKGKNDFSRRILMIEPSQARLRIRLLDDQLLVTDVSDVPSLFDRSRPKPERQVDLASPRFAALQSALASFGYVVPDA